MPCEPLTAGRMLQVPRHLYQESQIYQSGPAGTSPRSSGPASTEASASPKAKTTLGSSAVVHLRDLGHEQVSSSRDSMSSRPAYSAGSSMLGKRNLEHDHSLALVGDLLQNQSRRMIQLLEEQQRGRVCHARIASRSRVPPRPCPLLRRW